VPSLPRKKTSSQNMQNIEDRLLPEARYAESVFFLYTVYSMHPQ
jgi:hypothetical protein